MESTYKLSVVIPVLNEEGILFDTSESMSKLLDDVVGPNQWQLVIVDNGSTDATPQIMDRIQELWPSSLPLHLPEKNIGAAMKAGFYAAQGEWVLIMPVDECDEDFIRWVWAFRDSYDLIIGSKRCDPTLNHQTRYRKFLSWGLNALLYLMAGHTGTDTHGPKLLSKPALLPIIDRCVISRGQFDTELSARSVRTGLRVAEVPVIYKEKRPARNLMVTKILRNIHDLFRLRKAIQHEPWNGPLRFHRWSREDVVNLEHPLKKRS